MNLRLTPLVMLYPSACFAQTTGRVATGSDSVATTVEAAEQRGARHPRPTGQDRTQRRLRETWVGTDERRCVEVRGNNIVRSGEFIAGPFLDYYEAWLGGHAKVWWRPTTLAVGAALGTGPPLVVQAVRLDSAGPAVVFNRLTLSRTIPDSVLFYPSDFRLPSQGRWLLVTRAGRNWGCFQYWLPPRP